MNFLLMRSTQHVVADHVPVHEPSAEPPSLAKPTGTLEGLISEDSLPQFADTRGDGRMRGGENNGAAAGSNGRIDSFFLDNHIEVSDDEGWIAIPFDQLPDNWVDAPDIYSLRCHDRSFVFPGEHIHILACLSARKQDTEIITPFKVAAVMTKNGIGKTPQNNCEMMDGTQSPNREGEASPSGHVIEENGKIPSSKEEVDAQKEISVSESLLRMEDYKRQTELLMQKFKDSHFFVRIADSNEPLWSTKGAAEASTESSEADSEKNALDGAKRTAKNGSYLNALVDRGKFDSNVSGGVARNDVKCCSLANGDLVVLLEVNVGVDHLKDPLIEVLQFEKSENKKFDSKTYDDSVTANHDPCRELLKWLLPLDNIIPPSPRPLSPPPFNSGSISNVSQKPSNSGSQLFSFGHFRSYSMSSIPQNAVPPAAPVKTQSSKPTFDLEEWDQYSSQKLFKNQRSWSEHLLSFRGVSLEQERFSVRCGLEGIYIPGRRWRRKLEIIQPVEIHSFAADCNTDDFLCVQIKNVSPEHAPDIVVYIDAISIVFEEASKGGPPSTLPIACIEAGNDHSLPNLALRRGEEHSFILKPASPMWKNLMDLGEKSSQLSSLRLPSKNSEGRWSCSSADRYAVMVSCRCNYTESKLFFKKTTSWKPHIPRDLMISIASEMSGQSSASLGRDALLPVQVLTLQASNMTSQDLTLTVLAPASFTAPPSIVSLASSPKTPMTPFLGFSGLMERHGSSMRRYNSAPIPSENQNVGHLTVSLNEPAHSTCDVVPSAGLGCTHLWMHSRVPLGCVPSQSSATIKLELLPLTDGIIALDTLQIDVKEKGMTYIPEHSLKINATSSIATRIV